MSKLIGNLFIGLALIFGLGLIITVLYVHFTTLDYQKDVNRCLTKIAREECKSEGLYFYRLAIGEKPLKNYLFECKENLRLGESIDYSFLDVEIDKCKSIAEKKEMAK